MKSSGYINELAYLTLVYGLIDTSVKVENGEIKETPKSKAGTQGLEIKGNYKLSKRINNRLLKIKGQLYDFFTSVADDSIKQRVAKRSEKLLFETLRISNNSNLQLDFLALYVLFLRLFENDKLHRDFEALKNDKYIFDTIDLVKKDMDDSVEERMFDLAYRVKGIL